MHRRWLDIFRVVSLLMAASALGGCGVQTRYVKGELLNEETRPLESTLEYGIIAERDPEAVRPTLLVSIQRRFKILEEYQPQYQQIEITRWRQTAFQPRFFLWPVNLVRTPAGLLGCGLSAFSLGAHKTVQVVGLVFSGLGGFLGTALIANLTGARTTTGGGLAVANGLYFLTVGLLETPLTLLDLPQTLAFRTPIYPAFRELPGWPGEWKRAIRGCWAFALDYRTYPPFFIWPNTMEDRRPVPGEPIVDEWRKRERFTDWGPTALRMLTIDGPRGQQRVIASGDSARIDLLELAEGLADQETLTFTISAETPQGTLTESFSFSVHELRWPAVVPRPAPLR